MTAVIEEARSGADVDRPPATPAPGEPGHPLARTGRRRRRRRGIGLVVPLAVLAIAVLAALMPEWFTTKSPYELFSDHKLQGPSSEHPFGTDNLGRDVYTRVIYGARISLVASLFALGISCIGGSVLGLAAGSIGGRADAVIMRVTDLLMSVPSLMMSLAIVAALGFGTQNVALAVGLAGIAPFARLMRSSVIVTAQAPFVEAGRLAGRGPFSNLIHHVLPNAFSQVAAYAALEFGASIIAISSLSFLGLGVIPPEPEWGALMAEGRGFLSTAWWMTTFPGIAVTAVVVAANGIYLHFQRLTKEGT
jgi:peptide/nickel transport system permease protein